MVTSLVAVATVVGHHARGAREPPSERVPAECCLARALTLCGSHERIMLLYLAGLLLAVLGGEGPGRPKAFAAVALVLAAYVLGLVVVRSARRTNVLVDRLGRLLVVGVLVGTFVWLDVILPSARGSRSLDAGLLALDVAAFGAEPAQLFDALTSPRRTEWFAFFYFSYFVLIAAHVLPAVLVESRTRIAGELARGLVFLYCVGQLVYTIVPGLGPYATMTFEHPLEGAVWWPLVQASTATVNEASRTDIFPSLHTAAPLFLALFAFRNRALLPFKFTWPVLAVFSTQIMLATMYLRWHYLADVLAGIVLAIVADRYARGFTAEERAREARGLPPLWRP